MPLDTSIISQLRPIQVADPIESYGRTLSLKHMIDQGKLQQGQQELQQQQIQAGTRANEENDRAVASQQAIREAYARNPNNPEAAEREAMQSGRVFPAHIDAIQKARLANAKSQLNVDDADFNLSTKRNSETLGTILEASKLAPKAYRAMYPQYLQKIQKLQPKAKFPTEMIPQERLADYIGLFSNQEASNKLAAEMRAGKKAKDESLAAAALLPGTIADSKVKVDTQGSRIAEAGSKATEAQTKAFLGDIEAGSQLLSSAETLREWVFKRSKLKPEIAAQFPEAFDPKSALRIGLSPKEKQTAADASDALKETARGHTITQQYQNARLNLDKKQDGDKLAERAALAKVVMDNPNLYDDLTPTEKGHVAPELAKAGFVGFGKPLGAPVIKQLAESRASLDSINRLKKTMEEFKDYIGPVAGLQSYLPYSDARKADAAIKLAMQNVGKNLEGGVLKKDDREFYKNVLAKLRDTPDQAFFKLDDIVKDIEGKIAATVDENRRAGKKVVDPKPKDGATASGNGTIRARDPQGVLHEAKAGTKLPAGWRQE